MDAPRRTARHSSRRTAQVTLALLLGTTSCRQAPRYADMHSVATPVASSSSISSCCAAQDSDPGGAASRGTSSSLLSNPTEAVSRTFEPDRSPAYTRTIETYRVPDVVLVNQDGERVALRTILEGPEPVALNFVFTTCTTICPVMTATFSGLETELADDASKVHLVSISLDPQYDSPKMLKRFASRYGAGPAWEFLTGDLEQVTQTYRAFDAVEGSKFSHRPFTLLRAPETDHWLRIEGLTSVADLAYEVRHLRDEADSTLGDG